MSQIANSVNMMMNSAASTLAGKGKVNGTLRTIFTKYIIVAESTYCCEMYLLI